MKDRIPQYPGRVRLTPVAGQEGLYDIERADAPVEPGTPLNKASLLSDTAAQRLNLPASATVSDALGKLAGGVLLSKRKTLLCSKEQTYDIEVESGNIRSTAYFAGHFWAMTSELFLLRSANGVDWYRFDNYSKDQFSIESNLAADQRYLYFCMRQVSSNITSIYRIDAQGNQETSGSIGEYVQSNKLACGTNGQVVVINWGQVYQSTNYGATVTKGPRIPFTKSFQGITYGNGRFVAVAASNKVAELYYSTDGGVNWKKGGVPQITIDALRISSADNGLFFLSCLSKAFWSRDCMSWTEISINTPASENSRIESHIYFDKSCGRYVCLSGDRYVLAGRDVSQLSVLVSGNGNMRFDSNFLVKDGFICIPYSYSSKRFYYVADFVSLMDLKGERVFAFNGPLPDDAATLSLPAATDGPIQRAQQDITDLELADIEQGQALTDLELTIMEGQSNV